MNVEEKCVILSSTEQEIEQIVQLNPNSNVHWLEQNKSRIFFGNNRKGKQKYCVDILRPTFHTHMQLLTPRVHVHTYS
jgi:hypothetical protein